MKTREEMREETLTDQIATIVQVGHRDRKTSHEVAQNIVGAFCAPAESRPTPRMSNVPTDDEITRAIEER